MSQHVVNITTQVDQTGLANLNATTQQHIDLLRQVAAQAKATQAATVAGSQAHDFATQQIDAVNNALASGSAQMVVQQTNLKNLASALNAMGNTTGAANVTQQVAALGKQLGQSTGPIAAVKDSLLQFKAAYEGAGHGVNGLMAAMNAGLGTWLAWGFAAKTAAGYAKASVHEFSEAENALVKLDASLAQNGRLVGDASKKYQELASTLQDRTNVQATRWLGVLAQLNQRGANPENIERYSEAVAQLSTLMGGNIERAAQMFGRAMDGSFMHFRRYGINVKEAGTNSEKLESAIRQIGERGAKGLEPQLQTVSGHFKALSNNMADLRENIGESVVAKLHLKEILYGLAQSVKWFNETLKDMRGWLETLPGPLRTILELLPFMPSALDKVKVANDASALAADKASKMTELHAKALKEQKEAAEDAKKATDDYVTSIKEEAKAQNELLDAETKLKLAQIDADEKTGRIDKVEAARRRMNVKNESDNKKFSIKQAELGGEIEGAGQELAAASKERSDYLGGVQRGEKRVQVARALQGLGGRGTDADIAKVFQQAGLERDNSLLDSDAVRREEKVLRDLESEDRDGKKTRALKKAEDEARKKYNSLVKRYSTNQTTRSLEAQASNLKDSVEFPQSQAQFSLEEKLKREEFNQGETARKLGSGNLNQRDKEEETRKATASKLQAEIYKAQLEVQKAISGGSPEAQKVAAQRLQMAVADANQKGGSLFVGGQPTRFDLSSHIPQGNAGNMGGITPQGVGLVQRGTAYRVPTQNVPVIPEAKDGPVTLGKAAAIPGQAAPSGPQVALVPGQPSVTIPAGSPQVALAPGVAALPGQVASGVAMGQLGAGVPVPLPVIIVGVRGGGIPVTTGGGGGYPVIGGGGGGGGGAGGGGGGTGGPVVGVGPGSPVNAPSSPGGAPSTPSGDSSSPNVPSSTTPTAGEHGPGGEPKPGGGHSETASAMSSAVASDSLVGVVGKSVLDNRAATAGVQAVQARAAADAAKAANFAATRGGVFPTKAGSAAVAAASQEATAASIAAQQAARNAGLSNVGTAARALPGAQMAGQVAGAAKALTPTFASGASAVGSGIAVGAKSALKAAGPASVLLDYALDKKTFDSDTERHLASGNAMASYFGDIGKVQGRHGNTADDYGFGWYDETNVAVNLLGNAFNAVGLVGRTAGKAASVLWTGAKHLINDDSAASLADSEKKGEALKLQGSDAVSFAYNPHNAAFLKRHGLAYDPETKRIGNAANMARRPELAKAKAAAAEQENATKLAADAARNAPFEERKKKLDEAKARFKQFEKQYTPQQRDAFSLQLANMERQLEDDRITGDLKAAGASDEFIAKDRADRAADDDAKYLKSLTPNARKQVEFARAQDKKRKADAAELAARNQKTKRTSDDKRIARLGHPDDGMDFDDGAQPEGITQTPDAEPVSEAERLAKLAAAAGMQPPVALEAGGHAANGRLHLVGEQGPELFVPSQSGTVVNADDTAEALERAGAGISNSGAQMAGAVGGLARLVIQSNGATIAVVAEMAATIQAQAGQLSELREYVKNQR